MTATKLRGDATANHPGFLMKMKNWFWVWDAVRMLLPEHKVSGNLNDGHILTHTHTWTDAGSVSNLCLMADDRSVGRSVDQLRASSVPTWAIKWIRTCVHGESIHVCVWVPFGVPVPYHTRSPTLYSPCTPRWHIAYRLYRTVFYAKFMIWFDGFSHTQWAQCSIYNIHYLYIYIYLSKSPMCVCIQVSVCNHSCCYWMHRHRQILQFFPTRLISNDAL